MEKRSAAAAEMANKNKRLAEAAEEKYKEVAKTYRKRQKQAEEREGETKCPLCSRYPFSFPSSAIS